MNTSKFIHLHVHSHYSLLDGLSKIEDILEKCQDFNMDAVALTDHGNLYGAIEFYKLAKEKNIKPILGCEFYIAKNSYLSKTPKIDQKRFHLTILVKNFTGYQNLIKLSTHAWIEGFYYKPRIDYELLEKYSEGLICLSGCLNGQISKLILSSNIKEAQDLALKLKRIFGKDSFYLEIQPHPNLQEQKVTNTVLIEMSKKLDIPLVLTYDSHYIKPTHKTAQDILIAIQTNEDNPEERMSMKNEDFSFPDESSMHQLIKVLDLPEEAMLNTLKIRDLVNLEIPTTKKIMPVFKTPKGEDDFEYLKKLAESGLKKMYDLENLDADRKDLILKRFNYELGVIKQTGFYSYFLIVQDFINYARSKNIVVGPGRGSAAGSIISYLLGITQVDPLKYNLMFERFLNPERINFPDIDIDFADTRRDEVIEYARNKYGKDNVAQIVTFGRIKSRQAVRDVGRILGLPYSTCDGISKLIPANFPLRKAMLEIPELKKQYNDDSKIRQVIDIALDLEGTARHVSKHACGIVMADKPLNNYLPLQYAADSKKDTVIISQYDMKAVEEIGLLKMDFLGLRNLTTIEDCSKLLKKHRNIEINLDKLEFNDAKTFELMQKGKTTGVFQLESDGMKRYLSELKPTELEDVIAMISLYRPGPLDAGQVNHYIKRRAGKEEIDYLHISLKPILEKTYGIAVYQEQLIDIAKQLGGFTYSEADKLRKAVGKKIKSLLVEEGEKLIKGMVVNGINEQTAKRIWNWFIPFARYGFNRSHAASYAFTAYRTAHLKANYPLYFMCSLLINEGYKIERISHLLDEASKMGIKILPPDVNESEETFTPIEEKKQSKIRFGLGAIRNVGENLVKAIVKERNENGKFQDITDFLKRVKHKDLNKKSLEALIKSGSLDKFENRSILIYNIEKLLKISKDNDVITSQDSLFGETNNEIELDRSLNQEISVIERLRWEREFLGLYISGHPLDEYKDKIKMGYSLKKIRESNLKSAKVVAIITFMKKILTRNNKRMVFCNIEDLTGTAECIIFPDLYSKKYNIIKEESILMIKGKIEKLEDQVKIIAEDIEDLSNVQT